MVICVVDYYAAIQSDITEKCWGAMSKWSQIQSGKRLQRKTFYQCSLTKVQQDICQNLSHGIMDCFPFLFSVFSQFPAIKMCSFGNLVFCHENLQNPSSSTNQLGYSAHGHFTAWGELL